MIETKPINDTCPACGRKYKSVDLTIKNGFCTLISGSCNCGYTCEMSARYDEIYAAGEVFFGSHEEKDAIDKWNQVNKK